MLLGHDISTSEDMQAAAKDLTQAGCSNVLLKGGHLTGEDSSDLLYQKEADSVTILPGTRIDTPNSHGTGCTLSSAICAGLARGMDLEAAVRQGKNLYCRGPESRRRLPHRQRPRTGQAFLRILEGLKAMEIILNGQPTPCSSQTLADLIQGLIQSQGLNPDGLIAEVNRGIVRQPQWPETTLKDRDTIELLSFVAGG